MEQENLRDCHIYDFVKNLFVGLAGDHSTLRKWNTVPCELVGFPPVKGTPA